MTSQKKNEWMIFKEISIGNITNENNNDNDRKMGNLSISLSLSLPLTEPPRILLLLSDDDDYKWGEWGGGKKYINWISIVTQTQNNNNKIINDEWWLFIITQFFCQYIFSLSMFGVLFIHFHPVQFSLIVKSILGFGYCCGCFPNDSRLVRVWEKNWVEIGIIMIAWMKSLK